MIFKTEIGKLTELQKKDLVSLEKHAGYQVLVTLFERHLNILKTESYKDITVDTTSVMRQGNRQGQGVMMQQVKNWLVEAKKELGKETEKLDKAK